jgi:hypothetical protein
VLRDAKHSIPVEHPRAAANLVRTYADPVRRDATAVGLQSAREIHD